MKNNRKKQTSSYLLIFLGIVAALLILIILYLTFFRKDSQRSINPAKNGSATAQTEDFTDGETSGFTSSDETSDDADQSGFVSDDGSSDSESSTDDSSVQGPSQRESAGSVQSSPTPEEVTVPYQTPAANAEPVGSSQSSGSDSAQTTDGTSQGKKDSTMAAITPELSDDDGTISPSHGSSAFDNKSDEKMDALVTQVQSQLPGVNGSWSVYICDLAGGSEATINDSPMQAASLIKLFIMGAVYENYDSLSQQYGSATLDSYLTPMITVSDNESCNELGRLQSEKHDFLDGAEKVNEYLEKEGYSETSYQSTLHPSSSAKISLGGRNMTSVKDCGLLLERIYRGECVSEEASAQMLDLLKRQENTSKIPAGIKAEVPTANKTGETDEDQHDIAIVYGAKTTYILCVMSEGWKSGGDAVQNIQNISSMVYNYLNL